MKNRLGQLVFLCILFSFSITSHALPGDVAPRGAPDGQFDVADIIVLQQFVLGGITPSPEEFISADVAPKGAPDGIIDIADIIVLQNAVLAQESLPSTFILCLPGNGCSEDAFLVGATYFQETVDANGNVSIIYYDVNKNVLNVQYDASGKIVSSDLVPAYSAPSDTTGSTTTVVGSIGGQFSVSPSGAANYSVGIDVPPGTAGMQPQLAVGYDSQAGNGLIGMGWSMAGLSAITRCPKTLAQDNIIHGVDYTATDAFCLDGQRLINVGSNEYRAETGNAIKVIYSSNQFTVYSKDGTTSQYGFTTDSSIEAQGKSAIRVWAINRVTDQYNNYYTYTYEEDNANGSYRITSIDYTGNTLTGLAPYASVNFVYEPRLDIKVGFKGGSKESQLKRLQKINVNHSSSATPVSTYNFTYYVASSTNPSKLKNIQKCNGSQCLPALTAQWESQSPGFNTPTQILGSNAAGGGPSYSFSGKKEYLADVTGDGLPDRIWMPAYRDGELWVAKSLGGSGTSATFDTPTMWLSPNAAPGILNYSTIANGVMVDVNGDGKADRVWIPKYRADIWVALSTGSSFATPQMWLAANSGGVPVESWARLDETYADMDGDGRVDRVWAPNGRTEIWVALSDGTKFQTPTKWASRADIGVHVTSDNGNYWFYLDINGDGMTDRAWIPASTPNIWVAISEGNKFKKPTQWLSASDAGGVAISSWGGLNKRSVDVNGDGLLDYVWRPNGRYDIWVALSNGTSFETPSPWLNAGAGGVPAYSWSGVSETYFDVNADGLSDKVWVPDGRYDLWVALSDGTKFLTPQQYLASNTGGGANTTNSELGARTTYGDINGDGSIDRVWMPKDRTYIYAATAKAMSSRIISIDNGAGIIRNIQHKPLTDNSVYTKGTGASFPDQDIQYPQYVVSEQSTTDGLSGTTRITYKYGEAKVNLHGRGQLGFGWTESNNTQTGLVSKVTYRQDFPYTGMVASETQTLNGKIISTKINTPQTRLSDKGRPIPFVSPVVITNNDIDGSYLTTNTTTSILNEYGDVETSTTQTKRNGVANSTYTSYVNNVYAKKASSLWHEKGLVTQSSVYKTGAQGTSPTVITNYAYFSTGKLQSESGSVNGQAGLTKAYTYDLFGHINTTTISASDIATRVASTRYNSTGQYAETITNEMGHSAKITAFDFRWGAPLAKQDANGLVTTYIYNNLGELTETRLPGGNKTVTSKDWCTQNCTMPAINGSVQAQVAKYIVTTQAFGGSASAESYIPDVKVFYDKLGREIRKRTTSYDGKVIYMDTAYDNLGRVVASTQAYYSHDTSNKNPTTTSYDTLGRPTYVSIPGEGATQIIYDGFTSSTNGFTIRTIKNVNNSVTGVGSTQTAVEVKNVIGQVLQNTDNDGNVLYYEYDAQGNKIKTLMPSLNAAGAIANAKGTVITIGYDNFGRKTSMVDPNMGSWTYVYDLSSKLRSQTDALLQTTTMVYDRMGRMVQRTDHDGTKTYWDYNDDLFGGNTPNTMAIGKLDTVYMTKGGTETYRQYQTYTATLGLADLTTTLIDGALYSTQTEYDRFHRPEVVSYPETSSGTRLKLKYAYENGALNTVQREDGSVTYWQAKNRDVRGGVRIATLGNGVEQWRSYDIAGRLTWLNFGYSGNVYNVNYQYDSLGNLVYRDSQRSGSTQKLEETFSYDTLNRLTNVSINSMVDQNFSYDVLGNIRTKSAVTGYEYGSARPHAVSKANGVNYNYNNNGSILSSGDRSVAWTTFNKPQTITNSQAQSKFNYGPSRARYKHENKDLTDSTKNSRTIYIGGAFEKFTQNGVIKYKHYIKAGGETIAQYTVQGASNKTEYFHRDNQGSLIAVSDNTGAVKAQLDYDAFGRRRAVLGESQISSMISAIPRGYTGHEHLDKLGLIHMNGRVYDPELGRFLSADPIVQFAKNIQSYNRYSYVLNNPMSYTDPSGFSSKKLRKALKAAGAVLTLGAGNTISAAIMYSKPVKRLFLKYEWARVAGQIASTVYGGAGGSAAFAAYLTDISGGSFSDVVKAATIAGASAWATGKIGTKFKGLSFSDASIKILAHGAVGCAGAAASGGSCKKGAALSIAAQSLKYGLDSLSGFNTTTNTATEGSTVKPAIGSRSYNEMVEAGVSVDVRNTSATNIGNGVTSSNPLLVGQNIDEVVRLGFGKYLNGLDSWRGENSAGFTFLGKYVPGFNAGSITHDSIIGKFARSLGIAGNGWDSAITMGTAIPFIGLQYKAFGTGNIKYMQDLNMDRN